MADFFDNQAELGSEEEDDDFDEETGESKPREKRRDPNGIEDSSEEDDDEDEEAERAVRPFSASGVIRGLTRLLGSRRLHCGR